MGSEKREQLLVSRMERRRRRILVPAVTVIASIVICALLFCLFAKYRPPKHEEAAKQGNPKPAEEFLYGSVQTEYNYGIGMAANLYQQENGDVYIYFTNPISNDVYLRCELIDQEKKKVLYSTGYIEPGEYIETINNPRVANKQYDITVRVYAYTKDSFTSEGTTEISLMLQPW